MMVPWSVLQLINIFFCSEWVQQAITPPCLTKRGMAQWFCTFFAFYLGSCSWLFLWLISKPTLMMLLYFLHSSQEFLVIEVERPRGNCQPGPLHILEHKTTYLKLENKFSNFFKKLLNRITGNPYYITLHADDAMHLKEICISLQCINSPCHKTKHAETSSSE